MRQFIFLLSTMTFSMQTQAQTIGAKAPDFTAATIDGKVFQLSDLSGKKVYLAFFRNGACALCNLRVHEIIGRKEEFDKNGIEIVGVFESSVDDMVPYVGQQHAPFTLLSDPGGKIYTLYGVASSPEIVKDVLASGAANARVEEAAKAGFQLTKQEGANFYRIPAEVLIDSRGNIVEVHHADKLTNHLSLDHVMKFK